jgi:hypothetical protein
MLYISQTRMKGFVWDLIVAIRVDKESDLKKGI